MFHVASIEGQFSPRKTTKMTSTDSTSEIIRIATSYADVAGRSPTGRDFMTACVAAGVKAEDIRAVADVAMTNWSNANPIAGNINPTLAQKAAMPGKPGKKARALMASGKYTGQETISNQSGRWEIAK